MNFELTPFDRDIIAEANAQANIARKYAIHYDVNEDDVPLREFPEAVGRPDPLHEIRNINQPTSGSKFLEAQIILEYSRGDAAHLRKPKVCLGNYVLSAVGTPEQIHRWDDIRIAIAITEPGAGSDPSRVTTTATFDEKTSEWVLNGEKIFITFAEDAEAAMVFARIKEGDRYKLTTFVVEKGTPGFKVEPQLKKMGIRAEDTAGLVFTECRIPAMNHVNADFKAVFSVFNLSRPVVAAVGLGISRAILDYVNGLFPELQSEATYAGLPYSGSAIEQKVIELEAEYEAAWLTMCFAKWQEQTDQIEKERASMSKAMGGNLARRVSHEALEFCGSHALFTGHLMEKWFRDARIVDIYEGAGEVQRLLIARSLLGYTPKELK